MDVNKKIGLTDLTQPTTLNIPDQSGSSDEISLMAIGELLNHRKIKSISRIKPEQTATITKLFMFSKTFRCPFTKDLAETILQLQISINGLGRKELVQLVQKRIDTMEQTRVMTSKDIFR
jgi:hypothetical protein